MRVSLTAKQTAAVTALIALSMTVLSTQHLASLGRVGLENSQRNGELLGRIIYQKARDAVAGAENPVVALRSDAGIRSILESTAVYGRNVTYAALVDNKGIAVAHSFRELEGRTLEPQERLSAVLDRSMLAQIRAIYADRTLEVVLPLQLGASPHSKRPERGAQTDALDHVADFLRLAGHRHRAHQARAPADPRHQQRTDAAGAR